MRKTRPMPIPRSRMRLTKPLLDADNTNVGLYPANIPNMDLAPAVLLWYGMPAADGHDDVELMSSTTARTAAGSSTPAARYSLNRTTTPNGTPSRRTQPLPPRQKAVDPYNNRSEQLIGRIKTATALRRRQNLYANFNYYWVGGSDNIPELFMTAAQVHFLKAEVYARGLRA